MKIAILLPIGFGLLVTGAAHAERLDYLNLAKLNAELDASVAASQKPVEAPGAAEIQKPVEAATPAPNAVAAQAQPTMVDTFWFGVARPDRTPSAGAQPASAAPVEGPVAKLAPLPPGSMQAITLGWFDKFVADGSLFAGEDIQAMRVAISRASDKELSTWLDGTVPLRDAIETGEWVATKKWLQEFWQVQAMYKDDELSEFRQRLTKLSPRQILIVMDHFANEFLTKTNRLRASNQRKAAVANNASRLSVRPSNAVSRPTSGGGGSVASPIRPRRTIQRSNVSERIKDWYVFRGFYAL